MTADIVNLRQARKAKARAEKEKQASENRARFGRTKAEKQRTAAEADRETARHEGARREAVEGPRDDGDTTPRSPKT